ncbi:MAG TPA: sugar phosphate isomerase/epimerase family protein [Pirellulaceae bacterium]|nr:sugar phosphate isomerase/epimerase family protein [Pirellulaceae bacterium]HMO91115.1 sugar phosphate isomerase/epimerase family protein [Pirellulaceae bacterium]HMP70538.1 sugar phosphate isomerase/epimerase family protein [Pirellulaceae bacterium]
MLQLKTGIPLAAINQPLKQALPIAHELGVQGIELNARTELRPSELSKTGVRHLRKLLQDYNLQVCSVTFPTRRGFGIAQDLEQRLDATKAALRMAFDLGCNHVSNFVSVASEGTEATILNEAMTDLANFGQRIGARFAIRTRQDSGEVLNQFINSLPPTGIVVDFDPAELLIHKHSAVESLTALAEHVVHFRARDAVHDLSLGKALAVQLGRGSNDWPSLLGKLEEYQYTGFLTIDPQNINALDEAKESLEYLQNLFN